MTKPGKKSFTGGLDSLLSSKKDEPKKARVRNSSTDGLPEDEVRYTVIIKTSTLEKLKAIAYWDRLKIKDVTGEALDSFIENYEKEKGAIKPIPER